MKHPHITLALLLAAASTFLSAQLTAQTVVIVNSSVSARNLGSKELMDIFTLNNSRWDNGTRITVYDLKSGRAKDAFHEFIGMSEEELKKIWLRKQFTGKARPPKSISNEEALIDLVAETEGAIGYVSEKSLKTGKNVRIVARIR
jgi:ABC-type phosphate transport system substrate-binding protein